MTPNQLRLHCFGPYSFFENPSLPCVSRCEHRASQGIYLWTLPIDGTHRVNYVGKTSNRAGFAQRFAQELHFAEKGKSNAGKRICAPIVDCDKWFEGERCETNHAPTAEENDAAWPEMERTYRALHILLVPIEGEDQLRIRIESAIAWHLWDQCDMCRRFMCRPTQSRHKGPAVQLSILLRLPDGISVCGMNGLIEECVSSTES